MEPAPLLHRVHASPYLPTVLRTPLPQIDTRPLSPPTNSTLPDDTTLPVPLVTPLYMLPPHRQVPPPDPIMMGPLPRAANASPVELALGPVNRR